MELEMTQSSFEYALHAAGTPNAQKTFFELIKKNEGTNLSGLHHGIMRLGERYVNHLEEELGDRLTREEAESHIAHWRWYAAYILAGLFSTYGRVIPNFRQGLIEEMERDCDRIEKIIEREKLLCSFGEVSHEWISHFAFHMKNEHTSMCDHGVGYIFALGVAFIAAVEEQRVAEEERAAKEPSEWQDTLDRDPVAPLSQKVIDELEEIVGNLRF